MDFQDCPLQEQGTPLAEEIGAWLACSHFDLSDVEVFPHWYCLGACFNALNQRNFLYFRCLLSCMAVPTDPGRAIATEGLSGPGEISCPRKFSFHEALFDGRRQENHDSSILFCHNREESGVWRFAAGIAGSPADGSRWPKDRSRSQRQDAHFHCRAQPAVARSASADAAQAPQPGHCGFVFTDSRPWG